MHYLTLKLQYIEIEYKNIISKFHKNEVQFLDYYKVQILFHSITPAFHNLSTE